jgi:HlyD family secretion protein
VPDQLSSDLASLRIQRDVDPDRKSPLRTVAITIVVVGALAAGGVYGYPQLESRLFKTEVATTEISMVSPVQSSITLTSTGYVVPQSVSRVGAKIPGRLSKVNVKEGDLVKAGDVLAELEDADQKSQVTSSATRAAAARARAEAARAGVAEIQIQAERQKLLFEKGAVGKATVDDLVARQHSLEQQVKAAEAEARAVGSEVEVLKVTLKDRTITAPIDGTVVSKPAAVGELVGVQAPIAEIADFRTMLVETDVPEGRLYMVKPGSPCEIVLDAYPSRRYRGAVHEIGQRVNRAKGTVVVKVKFVDPMENVLPEMSARTSFLTEELSAEAMKEAPKKVVPAAAVTDRASGKVVFVVDQGKLKMVPVKLGPAIGTAFELLEGPPSGARLVQNPAPTLADGQRIKEKTD